MERAGAACGTGLLAAGLAGSRAVLGAARCCSSLRLPGWTGRAEPRQLGWGSAPLGGSLSCTKHISSRGILEAEKGSTVIESNHQHGTGTFTLNVSPGGHIHKPFEPSRGGDSATSLHSLFQCLPILSMKKFFHPI